MPVNFVYLSEIDQCCSKHVTFLLALDETRGQIISFDLRQQKRSSFVISLVLLKVVFCDYNDTELLN